MSAVVSIDAWRDHAQRRLDGRWANDELAECYRVVAILADHGMAVSIETGASDEGDPWAVFIRDDSQDVIIHLARIGGRFIVSSVACPVTLQGATLRSVLEEAVRTQPLVVPRTSSSDGRGVLFLHPIVLLAAFIATAFVFASQTAPAFAGERDAAGSDEADLSAAEADHVLFIHPSPKLVGNEPVPVATAPSPPNVSADGVETERGQRHEPLQHLLRASLSSAVYDVGARFGSSVDATAAATQVALVLSAAISIYLASRADDARADEDSMGVDQDVFALVSSDVDGFVTAITSDRLAPRSSDPVTDGDLQLSRSASTGLGALAQPLNVPVEAPTILASTLMDPGLVLSSLSSAEGLGSSVSFGEADGAFWEPTDRSATGRASESRTSSLENGPELPSGRTEPARPTSVTDGLKLGSGNGLAVNEKPSSITEARSPAPVVSIEQSSGGARQIEAQPAAKVSWSEIPWVDWLEGGHTSLFKTGWSLLASISSVSGPAVTGDPVDFEPFLEFVLHDLKIEEDDFGESATAKFPIDRVSPDAPASTAPASTAPASTKDQAHDIVQNMFKIIRFATASETRLVLDSSEIGFLKGFVQGSSGLREVDRVLVFEGSGAPEPVFMLVPGIAMIAQSALPDWVLLDDGEQDLATPFAQTLSISEDASIQLLGVVPLAG